MVHDETIIEELEREVDKMEKSVQFAELYGAGWVSVLQMKIGAAREEVKRCQQQIIKHGRSVFRIEALMVAEARFATLVEEELNEKA